MIDDSEEYTAPVNPWDDYAEAFAQFVEERERANLAEDPIISRMLGLLEPIGGREVLDACCGEGFFSRVLAVRGGRVTGIDLSPGLIEMAQKRNTKGLIDYRVADLSQPLAELNERFDLIACHLALNDVADYRGFASTLAAAAMPGGRIVLAFNNPYSSVVRGHIKHYHEPGAIGFYGGLSGRGVRAHYYHRTLEEYMDAFLSAGLRLTKLLDVPSTANLSPPLPAGSSFPFFMVLAFEKP